MVKEKVSNKVFLNKPEVQVLLLIIIEIIKLIKEKKEAINNKKISDPIKNPQIPGRLSESIALHLLYDGKIVINDLKNPKDVNYGCSKKSADLEVNTVKSDLKIEVKATGTSTFQRFRPNALLSKYIIWIDFCGLRPNKSKELTSDFSYALFETKILDKFKKENSNEVDLDMKNIDESDFKIKPTTLNINSL
jgi:hypothetical protein